MRTSSFSIAVVGSQRSWYLPIAMGTAAAAMVGVAAIAPWTIALWAGLTVFTLAFLENEVFILTFMFLSPVGMIASYGGLSDLGVAARGLVAAGMLSGRLCRGQLDIKELLRPTITRTSLLFLGAVVISAVFCTSGEPRAAFRGVYFIATYVAFFLAMFAWVNSREKLRKTLFTLMLSAVFVCLFAFYQWIAGGYTSLWLMLYGRSGDVEDWVQRPPSVLQSYGALGAYINLILGFALACFFLSPERKWRRLSGLLLGVGVVALLLTQTRGEYMGFVALLLVAVWFFARSLRSRILFSILLLAVISAATIVALRINPTRFNVQGDSNLLGRLVLWNAAWQLFQSSPIHGVGFGTFMLIVDRYVPQLPQMALRVEVHNVYFELLAETGLLGFITFCVFLCSVWRYGFSQRSSGDWLHRSLVFAVLASVVGTMVDSFANHNIFWAAQVGSLFWMLAALLAANKRDNHGSRETCSAVVWADPTYKAGWPGKEGAVEPL